jgi:hypothetical protein
LALPERFLQFGFFLNRFRHSPQILSFLEITADVLFLANWSVYLVNLLNIDWIRFLGYSDDRGTRLVAVVLEVVSGGVLNRLLDDLSGVGRQVLSDLQDFWTQTRHDLVVNYSLVDLLIMISSGHLEQATLSFNYFFLI